MMLKPMSIRHMLLLTISSLTLLITLLVAKDIYEEWQRLEKIQSLREAASLSDRLFDIADKLSMERDLALTMLNAQNGEIISLRPRLERTQQVAEADLKETLAGLKEYHYRELTELSQKMQIQSAKVQQLLQRVDQAMALPLKKRDKKLSSQWSAQVTVLILQSQDMWIEFIRHFADLDPTVALQMRFRYFLGAIMDFSGRERALIGRLIAQNAAVSPQDQADLLRWQGIVEQDWNIIDSLADQGGLYPAIVPAFKDAKSHYSNLYGMVRDIFYIPGAKPAVSYPISADFWLELASETTDSLYALRDAALKETHNYIESIERQTQQEIVLHTILLLFALTLCFYSLWVIIYRVLRPVNTMIAALVGAMQGKPVSFVPPSGNPRDEIDKLSDVLHAFQQNTEQIKRTSAELQRYTKALERSNKELDDFAYIASHDLKEPLRGLFNNARFLQEDYQDKIDPAGVARLQRLGYLCQRMEALVNDLLYFSRLGRQELAIQKTDLNAVIHDIEPMLDVLLKERNAKILIPYPLPEIICDKPRITEVFRNLIVNAVKYNDKPEKLIEIGYLKTKKTNGGSEQDVFYVKDNGIGIEPEFYEDIFRIFKRLNSETDDQKGTGVGLTFVKKIIERHGGRIWLESTPGQGTTFYFTIRQGVAHAKVA